MPRTRVDFTDQDLVRLAFARIQGLKTEGKLTEYKELERQFKPHKASVLAKAFPKAFQRNLVELQAAQTGSGAQRVSLLEQRLKAKFGLASAVVVDAGTGDGTSPERGDDVHKQIGEAMGDLIGEGTLFRDNDRIAIGSGRGVYHVVNRLAESGVVFGLTGVSLISLAGTLYPRHHARQPNVRLDADFHVQLLANCFSNVVDSQFASYPIVCANAHKATQLRRVTSLDPDKLAKRPPTHAIIGVGVLSQGHRFYEVARTPQQQFFESIRALLTELIELANKWSTPTYWPVWDVANHLQFLPSRAGAKPINAKLGKRIKALIRQINSRTLTLKENQLQSIASIILVAATPKKASAIYELLGNPRYHVRHLCTDHQTAEILLQLAQSAAQSA